MLAMVLPVCLFSGCSSSIEDKAEEQMRATMEELAKNPESLDISRVDVIYKNDSLCILQFVAKGQNGFGGYSSSRNEYIYMIQRDGGIHEALYDLNKEESVLKDAERGFEKNQAKHPGDTSVTLDNMITIYSATRLFLHGREVKK